MCSEGFLLWRGLGGGTGASQEHPLPKPYVVILCLRRRLNSAEHFKSFGSSAKHAEIGPESFGIVVHRSVGTEPDILGLVWLSFRPTSGSKSKISGRIL